MNPALGAPRGLLLRYILYVNQESSVIQSGVSGAVEANTDRPLTRPSGLNDRPIRNSRAFFLRPDGTAGST